MKDKIPTRKMSGGKPRPHLLNNENVNLLQNIQVVPPQYEPVTPMSVDETADEPVVLDIINELPHFQIDELISLLDQEINVGNEIQPETAQTQEVQDLQEVKENLEHERREERFNEEEDLLLEQIPENLSPRVDVSGLIRNLEGEISHHRREIERKEILKEHIQKQLIEEQRAKAVWRRSQASLNRALAHLGE